MNRQNVSPALQALAGESPGLRAIRDLILRIARTSVSVLIMGETGTGKGLCARAIHELSGRKGAFVAANCASFPESLSESTLFGHMKGAFTGAVDNRIGLLAAANSGTLFLDELPQLTPAIQAKLLDALESGEYRPVGATRLERSDFRLIAATNADIDELVSCGKFRSDLLYRIDCVRVVMPPLRDRHEDIPVIALHLLQQYPDGNGVRPTGLSSAALSLLAERKWSGNVRELRNVIYRAAALANGATILDARNFIQCMPHATARDPAPRGGVLPLETRVRQTIASALKEALERTNGNRQEAAILLETSPATLYRYLDELEQELSQLGYADARKRRNRNDQSEGSSDNGSGRSTDPV
jgi:DNA-binding NtrC family response regulator